MTPSLKLLFDRCEHVGFCRIWNQGTNANGVPIISLSASERSQSVRRLAYRLIFGEIPAGQFVYVDCGNSLCISGKCMKCGSKSDYMRAASKAGAYSGPLISKVRADAARARAGTKLTMEKARQIRAERAAGLLLREIAAKHGVSMDIASKVARGLIWRELAANASVFNQAA